MSLLLGLEPFQKFAVVGGGGGGWWWWSKGILEFRFGPNLGLRLEAWTKLNNIFSQMFQSFLHPDLSVPSLHRQLIIIVVQVSKDSLCLSEMIETLMNISECAR